MNLQFVLPIVKEGLSVRGHPRNNWDRFFEDTRKIAVTFIECLGHQERW